MGGKIIDGKALAEKIRQKVKADVGKLGFNPCLAVILAGNNHASELYVSKKNEACKEAGIKFELFRFPENADDETIIREIEKLNFDNNIHAILVQLPLPAGLNTGKILDSIRPEKDVDCLTSENLGKLFLGKERFLPATVKAVLEIIEGLKTDVKGKAVTVVGQSNIVGKPLSVLLANRFATVISCHIRTKNLPEKTKTADILISAVGKPDLITAGMIKKGAIVIDVGINKVGDKVAGDVDFEKVREVASHITPVPGGVGPMTVACLLENVLEAAKLQNKA